MVVQSKQSVCLTLPGAFGLECLRERWGVELHPQQSRVLAFWDSFEWGIWFAGHILYSCGEVYYLASLESCEDGWLGTVTCEERAEGRRRFWGDFQAESMREHLEGMLGLRALAQVAEGTFRQSRCDLRNETGKIVCRLEWSSLAVGSRGEEQLLHCCRVLPLLGYEQEAALVVEFLEQHGASGSGDAPLTVLLQHAGRLPQKYTLRPEFGLDMATPAREAVGRIVRAILQIAGSNLPGILSDLDTEFLHDYRICLRKIRSVLSLVKEVYPAQGTQRMRRILGDLARQTNRLRDLDVYLLARDEYLGLLPPRLRPALDGMFADFAAERAREVRRATSKLRSASSCRLLEEMEAFFAEHTLHEPSPAADLPVGPLVFRCIYKRYRKIRGIAAGIGAETPDEAVHRLRIECKKLRYLLEFFSELLPKKEAVALQKLLKRLQGRLGEFNDASVQQASLLSYWQQKKHGGELELGLGGLVAVLYQRQQTTRGLIEQELEDFCGAETAATFRHSFKLPENRLA